jgi:hypothetical protein
MTATQVNIVDPTTPTNQLAVNSLGQLAISNFPATQSVVGTVNVAAFPANQVVSGTIDVTDRTTRQLGVVSVSTGTLNVVPQATSSVSVTLQNAQSASANGTPLSVMGYGSVMFTVTMTGFTGTVNFEGSEDGTNYDLLLCTQQGTTTTLTSVSGTSTTSIHLYAAACAGLTSVRARTSNVSAGAVTVTAHAIPIGGSSGGGGGGGSSNASVSTTGSAVPASATYVGASDGANLKGLLVDASGFLKVNVAAGGGSGGTSSTFGAAFPGTGTASGFTDGTNMQAGKVFDADTGVGTEYLQGVILRKSASGGSVEAGTSSNPLRIDPTGTTTQPVSGTITANAGTGSFTVVQATGSNLHAVLDSGSTTAVTQTTASNLNAQVVGSVASGSSNTGNPVKIGGAFNTTQPTVTNGQAVDAQYTARGAAIVATGVDAFAVNASQSGTWNITNISGTVSLPTGAATSAKQPALGTAGSASTDVITVQGIASMTALKVDGSAVTQPVSGTVTANIGTTNGLALDTSVNGLLVSQGSTTSGQKGPLLQGAVTLSAPTYTTAQTSPISLTTAGAIRVDASATTQPISGTVTANAGSGTFTIQSNASVNLNQIAGSSVSTAATGIIKVGLTDASGNALNSTSNALNVSQQATGSVSATMQNAASANGNGTTLTTLGMATVAFTVSGTFSATINFEGTEDNSNWSAIEVTAFNSTTPQTTTTTTGSFAGSCAGMQSVRARISGYASGNVTVTAHAVPLGGAGGGGGGGGSNASVGTTASAVPASATYVGGNKSGNLTGLSLDASGNLNVNVAAGGGSGGTSSSFGAAFPATGTAIGASDGTNMQGLLVESSSNKNLRVALYNGATEASVTGANALKVDGSAVTQPVSGTITANAGTGTFTNQQSNITTDYDTSAGTQTMTMFGVALPASGGAVAGGTSSNPLRTDPTGTTTQPVSGTVTANIGTTNGLALDSSVNGLLVSQGSTTSGEKGPLIQGAVTTNAPSYTTAQTSPLSLDTSGLLRASLKDTPSNTNNLNVNLAASAATVTVSGTVTANQGGSNWSTNVAQFGGSNVVTGTGASGAGIPRVTLSNDSSLAANQSVNVNQIGGSAIVTAATGVQKVGIVGNAGATIDSTVGAGTAPTNQVVVGSVYNASAPAPTSGQAMALQADQAGNLRTFPGIALASLSAWNSSTGLNATQNIFTNSGAQAVLVQLTQTTTLTAGAITFEVSYDGSNWSTIPASGVLDPTSTTFAQISLPYTVQASTNKQFLLNMNGAQGLRIKLSTQITGTGTVTPNYALLPDSPTDTVIALSPTAANFNVTASQGGTWTVQPGNTANTTPWLTTINQGGNSATVTASNALKVDGSGVTQPVSGTVTANIGTTNGLALDTSVNGLLLSQGSTTSGQKGVLIQGAVTTNAPSYTTAQTSPLSLDTSGLLRASLKDTPSNTNNLNVNLAASAATVTVSGTVTANAGTGTMNVAQQASGSTSATLQSAQTGNANGTSLTVLGMATVVFTVTVSGFTGTVNFEGTEDNSNWSSLLCTLAGGTTTSTTATSAGQYSAPCAGLQSVRARTSGVSAGNVTVTAHAVPVSGGGGGGGSGSNASVGATASAVPSSATYLGANKSGNLTGLSLDTSGNLNVNVAAGGGSGGTSSNFGSAFPGTGTAIGASDGTNMQGLLVESSSNKNLRVALYNGATEASVTGANALKVDGSAVTQPANITQFGGNNVATGAGASGVGIPRVTVSNDSQVQVWDGTTGPVAAKAARTPPALADISHVHSISPNNTGLPVNLESIVQSRANKSSGSVASLALAFTSNNTQGNSIIVVCAVGNGTAPTISDTNSNSYTQAAQVANGTAFNVAVFYSVGPTSGGGIASGANTVTVNNGGTTASIAMEIYEVSGLITQVQAQPDATATATGSSGTAATANINAASPNEYAFAGVGIGTAAQTITVGSGWTNDSGQQNPTTPAGLFSFVSMSQFLGNTKTVTPQATFTSEPWAIAVATFRPVLLGIGGTVNVAPAASGYVSAYGSNPANTGTANTDATFKWGALGSTSVNHLMIQNNSTSNVLWDLDTATTSASPIIAPGQTIFFDVQTTVVHLQSATANVPINAASGLIVRGWL